MIKNVAFGICIFVVILLLPWVFMGNDYFLYKFFAPKKAAVEREVFTNTQSYNQGMIQELQNMQFEYAKVTDKEAKAAMRGVILHRAADFPVDRMPADLNMFISKLKSERSY